MSELEQRLRALAQEWSAGNGPGSDPEWYGQRLRALLDEGAAQTMPGARRHCEVCGTSWSVLSIRTCPTCQHISADPISALAEVPAALDDLS